ncbi:MAG: indolepyruvate oxidoreductase subunit beta [Deltaproteobacteria bacterium]|nr:indolepyruvate oxidoreductase subunit beta [Deltaproteobacteria bacterium]
MKQDIILAGVGGQGILTIAEAISSAALVRGLEVKQAEVHGMSQRGGAVQSHLRLADQPIYSDTIGLGHADLVIAAEPLESLRYTQYLSSQGMLLTSSSAFVNIGNYPPIESVLEKVARWPRHCLVDAERIARAAGSGRAANIVMLGAASLFLKIEPRELEESVAQRFASKGARVVEVNRRAFRFGRNAAQAYLSGLERGGTSVAVRHWIETLSADHLARPEPPDAPVFDPAQTGEGLTGAESHAVENALLQAYEEHRPLFEHEVYQIVQLVGAISPPLHVFLKPEDLISEEQLAQFPGDKVVLKIVSPQLTHKSDAQGVIFVPKRYDLVRAEIDRFIERHRANAEVRGVLVVEFVEQAASGFGRELFVGIRATREFGPVIAAGLGGVDTEYLAAKMRPGLAVAKAVAADLKAEDFLELFKKTVAYEILAGKVRGHKRIVSDGELLRCFRAFIHLAQKFCVDRGEVGPDLAELEVNPFAFRGNALVPLDGRARLKTAAKAKPARPIEKLSSMLEPQSIAVLGASATSVNFGRIILRNVIEAGFDRSRLYAIKDGLRELDGARCVPTLRDVPERIDLLVIAAAAQQLPQLITEAIDSGKVQSVILVPGGVGETEGTSDLVTQVEAAIARGRSRPDGGPAFLGPNSLGVLSRPGKYDTLFIPASRLDKRLHAPARKAAILSQSGAFIITRLSNLETLDPAFSVSIGNQLDVTVSDLLAAVGTRDDIAVVGIYAEGFNDLDGLSLLRQIAAVTKAGKDVILYKAGRTESGRSAAAGHTASVAGDYDICQAAAEQAGAIVVDTFKEFEQLLELCTALHDKTVSGVRLGVVSNAGFETVGMADAVLGQRYRVEIAKLGDDTQARLRTALEKGGLGKLVNARNPIDLTPMANEATYEEATRALLEADDVDAVIVGIVPLTAMLKTVPGELEADDALPARLGRCFADSKKPLVAVVDSGPAYEPLARAIRKAGLPVFRSSDQAVRSLGRYVYRQAGHTLAAE